MFINATSGSMMSKRIAWTIMLVLELSGLTAAYAEAPLQNNDLKQTIDSIIEEVAGRDIHGGRTLGPNDIFSSERFVAIYDEHSCEHLKQAQTLIAIGELNKNEEYVLAHFFYKLPLGSYLDWMQSVWEAYQTKRVSGTLIEEVIFPADEMMPRLYLAYKMPAMNNFYQKLSVNKNMPETRRRSVQRFLDGEYARSTLESLKQNNIPAPKAEDLNTQNRCINRK